MQNHTDMVDKLLEKECYIIDFLPEKVPEGSKGQFWEIEHYLLQSEKHRQFREKFARIILRIMCYYEVSVLLDTWISRPSPELLEHVVLEGRKDDPAATINVLLQEEKVLIVLDGDSLNLSVYNPSPEMQSLFEQIAMSEGLYWRASRTVPERQVHLEGNPVPSGKMASGPRFCRRCGASYDSTSRFCPQCGSAVEGAAPMSGMPEASADRGSRKSMNTVAPCRDKSTVSDMPSKLEISKVHFSAIAPRTLIKGDYTIIDIVMYMDAFRSVVDELIKEVNAPVQETKSGTVKVKEGARVKIILSSPDITIEDHVEEQEWVGEYLMFNFAVLLPETYAKRQVLFTATVYIDDVIATRLKFVAKCWSLRQQKIKVTQEDVLSAFVSYASQDRNRVAMIIQGMQKARPDMDIFFDVESLRSGETWENTLWSEIDQRDLLFLCWSHNAKESKWVDAEWRYAYAHKGAEAIEPIPLEPPASCPPPEELGKKHFNDRLLYVIKAESEGGNNDSEREELDDPWL